jgi:DNA-binding IclR family transcriptional regulator
MPKRAHSTGKRPSTDNQRALNDPLMVWSVEKAFRVLHAFSDANPKLSLTQLASTLDMDKSTIQRFSHTLTKLGYLTKDPETKRFELTVKSLELGHHYVTANPIIQSAMPYLLHLSQVTEETVNLTILDEPDVVFVMRFMSRHVLNLDTFIGSRLPAFCCAPGIAILSKLPRPQAMSILNKSDLRPHTPNTVYQIRNLVKKLDQVVQRGYATAFEEHYHGDLSIAAPVLNPRGVPVAAVNVAVSRARFSPEEAETRFAPLVIACALSIRPR